MLHWNLAMQSSQASLHTQSWSSTTFLYFVNYVIANFVTRSIYIITHVDWEKSHGWKPQLWHCKWNGVVIIGQKWWQRRSINTENNAKQCVHLYAIFNVQERPLYIVLINKSKVKCPTGSLWCNYWYVCKNKPTFWKSHGSRMILRNKCSIEWDHKSWYQRFWFIEVGHANQILGTHQLSVIYSS